MFNTDLSHCPFHSVLLAGVAGQQSILLLGLVTMLGGIVLMFRHQAHLRTTLDGVREERIRRFEIRKFRRRATVSAMIASVGVMIATMYWVTDSLVLSSLTFMTLFLVLGIFGMAMLDMFSVGVQHIAYGEKPVDEKDVAERYRQWRKEQLESGTTEADDKAEDS